MAKIPNPVDRSELIASFSVALEEGPHPSTIKTRMIEAHTPEPSPDGVSALLDSISRGSGLVRTASDDSIWILRDQEGDEFIVDALNPRFWLFHTVASARKLEQIVRVRMLSDARLDRAWLPGSLLDELPGDRRLVRSSYEAHRLFPVPSSGPGGDTRRLQVRVEGNDPDALLELLRADDRFSAAAAVGAVGTRLANERLGEARVVADYQGRCVSSGTSFEVALDAIWQLLDGYIGFIGRLENAYRLRTEAHEGGGFGLEGRIASVSLPGGIPNLGSFLQGLLSSREPFRLWGVPTVHDDGGWEVNAVDLHVGQTLRLEGTLDTIYVLLSEDTCGNTLARLLTNLQHHFNAKIGLPEVEAVPR